MTDAIKVAVRIRPLNKQELDAGHSFAWNVQGNTLNANDSRDAKYTLDHIFGPEWTTRQIYEVATKGLLDKVISGFNSTVFAYGQTSSGKTFTMRGSDQEQGLIPLAVREIFELLNGCQDREFLLRVSYMELYNEEVNDLLAPQNTKLPVHESKEQGVYVCGLREDIVTCPEAVLSLLAEGEANRHIGATKMNDTSSRSHTVFRMVVESRMRDAEGSDAAAILVSTLTLVDLAGSERVAKTGAEGIRMKEGTAINKSLLTLGNVINKLSEGALSTGGHIPYRDSKLTRILQPSLGGNAKTAIICAMTPAACHVEESHSTLRFACRAKRVVNNAVVNEVLSDAAVLKRQAKEIEELKKRLEGSGMSAEVVGQIGHLRGQLLRSEQENELMRIKLEEEKQEREKAQKQVEVARKMMFEGGPSREDLVASAKRNNRRETWCPGGKVGWAAPPGAVEALDAVAGTPVAAQVATPSAGAGGSAAKGIRKRPLSLLAEDSSMTGIDAYGGEGAIAEGDCEGEDEGEGEEDVDSAALQEGPTPQRRRRGNREGSSLGSEMDPMVQQEEAEPLLADIARIAQKLRGQDRATLEALSSAWRESLQQAVAMQNELDDVSRLAESKDEDLRSAVEQLEDVVQERDKLAPQLEQAKWQTRQLERRLEEMQEAGKQASKERDSLAEQLAAEKEASAANAAEQASRLATMKADWATLKDQVKTLTLELQDRQGALELVAKERELMEGRLAAAAASLAAEQERVAAQASKLQDAKKNLEAVEERAQGAESRARDLYETNQRMEAHVHDLESRKRAPLYQKKQEEELRAAVEKAMEADVRAQEAELRAKEFKVAKEAAEKQLADALAAADKAAQAAQQANADLAEQHSLELQRLALERTKLVASHLEEVEQAKAAAATAAAEVAELGHKLTEQAAVLAASRQEVTDVQAQLVELTANHGELQACATAASERIVHLEEAAEAAAAASEAAAAASEADIASLKAELAALQVAAAEAEACSVASLAQQQETHAAAMASAAEAAAQAVQAAEAQAAAAEVKAAAAASEGSRIQDAYKSQIDGLNAKLIEAGGALRAKDELKEERQKHKQEMGALKAELQKLQLENKTGAKGKDIAAKELEALKKKAGDLENKLKAAVQDKATAVQEKAKLEAQLKQQVSQKQILDKTLEKKDVIEAKKRESIMVNLNKSKEVLCSVEERLKTATLELQKTHMDLTAKRSECQSLEEQLAESEACNSKLKAEHSVVSLELTTAQHDLECLQVEHKDVQGQLATSSAALEALKTQHDEQQTALETLTHQHGLLSVAHQQSTAELLQLRGTEEQLRVQHQDTVAQLQQLQTAHTSLMAEHEAASTELARVRKALSDSEDARVAAESRVPEIEELQRQLATTHEEMADLQFASNEAASTAGQQQREALEQQGMLNSTIQGLEGQLAVKGQEIRVLQSKLASTQQELEQTVELYTAVQGQADALAAEKACLLQQLSASATDLAALQAQLASTQTAMQTTAAASAAEVVHLKSELSVALAALQAAEQVRMLNAAQAAAAAEASAAQVADLQQQLDQVTQEMTDLDFASNQERADMASQLAALRQQLAAAQDKSAASLQDAARLEAAAQAASAAEARSQSLAEQVASLTAQLQTACDRLSAAQLLAQQWETAEQTARQEARSVQAALEQAQADSTKQAAVALEAESRADALAAQLQVEREGLHADEAAMLQRLTAVEEASAQHAAAAQSAQAQLDQMAVDLERAREQVVEQAARLHQAELQVARLTEELSTARTQAEQQEVVAQAAQLQAEALASQLSSVRAESAEHMLAVGTAQQHLGELETALDTALAASAQRAAAAQAAQQEVAQLQGQLAEAQVELARRSSLASEMEALRAGCEELQGEVQALLHEREALVSQLTAAGQQLADTQAALAEALRARTSAAEGGNQQMGVRTVDVEDATADLLGGFGSPVVPQQACKASDEGSEVKAAFEAALQRQSDLEAQVAQLSAQREELLRYIDGLPTSSTQPTTVPEPASDPSRSHGKDTVNADAASQLERLCAGAEAAAAALAAKDLELQEAVQAYTDVSGQLAEMELQSNQLKEQVAMAVAAQADAEASLSIAAAAQHGSSSQMVQDLQLQVQQLREQQAATEKLLDMAAAELAAQADTVAQQQAVAQAQIASLEAQLQEAQQALAAATDLQPKPLVVDAGAVETEADMAGSEQQLLHQLQEQVEALTQEAATAQANCNRALAEKLQLERKMSLRVLELERAGFDLQDRLSAAEVALASAHVSAARAAAPGPALRSSSPTDDFDQDMSSPTSTSHHRPAGDADQRMEAMSQAAETLQTEVARLGTALANAVAAKEAVEARLSAQLLEAETARTQLAAELDARTQALQLAEAALQQAEQTSAMLKATAATADSATERSAAVLKSELTSAHDQLRQLLDREAELFQSLASANTRLESAQNMIKGLQSALQTEQEARQQAQAEGAGLRSQIEDMGSEVHLLTSLAQEASQERVQALQQAAAAESRCKAAEAACEAAKSALALSHHSITASNNSSDELAAQVAEQSAALEHQGLALAAALSEVAEQTDKAAALASKLQGMSLARDQAEHLLATERRVSAQLTSQVTELQQQLAQHEEKLNEAYSEAGQLKQAVAGWQESNLQGQQQLNELQEELEASQQAVANLQRELQAALTAASTAAQQLAAAQQQQGSNSTGGGPTAAQQELMARMAERLEALEAGHKRAVGRLQEELSAALAERAEAQLRLEAAVGAMDTDRQQQLIALEEIEMGAKAKEAELNARVLSLESQIHWLGEQNTQLTSALKKLQEAAATAPPANMAGAAAGPGHDVAEATSAEAAAASAHASLPAGAGAAALADKCAALEAELRRAKRAELKLQALLFRLRKDVEAVGVSGPAFDGLRDIRALEFEVDTLGQKLKRSERMAMQADAERQSLQAKLAQLTNTGALSCTEGSAQSDGCTGLAPSSRARGLVAAGGAAPLEDKENIMGAYPRPPASSRGR